MRLIILFILVIFTVPIRAQEKSAKVYEVGAEDAAGAWGREDGRGCGNEIVKAAFNEVGVNVKIQVLPYSRCKLDVISGKLAACYAMSGDSGLVSKVVFANAPIYETQAFLIGYGEKTKANPVLRRIEDLPQNSTIGLVNEYEYPEAFVNQVISRQHLQFLNDEETIVKLLQSKRIDIGVLNIDKLKSLNRLLKSLSKSEAARFRILLEMPQQGSFVGFSRSYPDGDFLKEAFDKGHAALIKSGKKAQIISACDKALN